MSLSTARVVGAVTTLALLTGGAVLPQVSTAQMTPTTTPTVRPNRQERHPELRAALRSLEAARDALQRGAHDYKGKRADALRDTNKAIQEVQQAIAQDQR